MEFWQDILLDLANLLGDLEENKIDIPIFYERLFLIFNNLPNFEKNQNWSEMEKIFENIGLNKYRFLKRNLSSLESNKKFALRIFSEFSNSNIEYLISNLEDLLGFCQFMIEDFQTDLRVLKWWN